MWSAQQQWSQWAIQPSMFNNVPHDEIDWAQLAKQWIQMQNQEPTSQPSGMPPQGPSYLHEDYGHKSLPSQMRDSHPPNTETFAPEAAGKHSDGPMDHGGPFPPDPSGGYWQQNWDVRAAAAADIDDRVWPPIPPPVPVDISAPMLPNEKKTFDYGHVNEAPTLAMQTVDYNHTSEHYGYGPPPMPPKKAYIPPPFPMYPSHPPPEDMYDQYWSQVAATPMIPATFFKKKQKPVHAPSSSSSSLSTPATVEEDISHIDAAKRKHLPAWIREGLEKMEQERLKRLEKERTEKERLEKAKKVSSNKDVLGIVNYGDSPTLPSKSKFDSDSEKEEDEEPSQDDNGVVEEKTDAGKEVVVPFLDLRSEEEKQRDLMLKVRRMLTEVLLSVTTEEMVSVAREVYQKALSKASARPLASSSALRSISSVGLGSLVGYDSQSEASSENEDEDNSTSDDELQQRIQEKKKQFAIKERHILEDLAKIEEQRRQTLEEEKKIMEDEQKRKEMLKKTQDATPDQSNASPSLNNGGAPLSQPEGLNEVSSLYPPALMPSEFTAELPPQSLEQEVLPTDENQTNDCEKNVDQTKSNSGASKSVSDISDSDSDSHSSLSRSSHSNRSHRKSHRSSEKRQSRSVKKSKSQYQSSSSHRKQGRHRNSRHGSSDSSKSHDRSKSRREASRGKKKNKGKDRNESPSSSSSNSSNHSRNKCSKHRRRDSHNSPERRRRRSWSYDGRSKHERSRSRSRSSKLNSPDSRHDYHESHHGSSKHHGEDYKRSRKDYKRSHSRSTSRSPPKRYKRKSRSPSYGRGRYIKHSKPYDR